MRTSKRHGRTDRGLSVGMAVVTTWMLVGPVWAAPVLIGIGEIAGTATDSSGLTEMLKNNNDGSDAMPHNRVGGLGSDIAYTGQGNRFVMAPDRGPADGATNYADRYYQVDIHVTAPPSGSLPGTLGTVIPSLVNTTLLKNELGQQLIGSSAAFDAVNSPASLRFDPEGIRVGKTGTLFVSDEYGPFLYEFGQDGTRLRSLNVPAKFLIQHPSAVGADELPSPPASSPGNSSGRQGNRGMEGLAISPDGAKLYGIMQSPLIQDGALNASNSRRGINNRLLEFDLKTGVTKEYLYQLSNRSNGVNELVALNEHEFLVVERDGNPGSSAAFKKIFKIDIAGATNLSDLLNPITALPQTGIPAGVIPVGKTDFLDLLAPEYGLAGASFPEKIEGLSFGPDLVDGRHLLLVTSDNDFFVDQPTKIYAFAIAKGDIALKQQTFVPEPASVLLLGSGVVALLAWRKRRSC